MDKLKDKLSIFKHSNNAETPNCVGSPSGASPKPVKERKSKRLRLLYNSRSSEVNSSVETFEESSQCALEQIPTSKPVVIGAGSLPEEATGKDDALGAKNVDASSASGKLSVDMWSSAYQGLRDKDEKLVIVYETILTQQLQADDADSEIRELSKCLSQCPARVDDDQNEGSCPQSARKGQKTCKG